MVAACFALLFRQLRYSHDPLLFTVFFALGELGYGLVAHSVLAYPSGRVTDRYERALVKVGYAVVLRVPARDPARLRRDLGAQRVPGTTREPARRHG